MSAPFRFGIAFVLAMEGGYAGDLGDGAGATKYGITAKAYPDEDIAGLTEERAMALYRRDYWDALQLDRLPLAVAVATFDAAVNHGPQTAYQLLQGVLGVAQDGLPGPVTQAAAHAQRYGAVRGLLVARTQRYAASPHFARFAKGWLTRVLACARYCDGLP